MQSQGQHLISLFRTIVLTGVTALLIASAALPMPAQNSVPPTAVQAARTPEFAQRLAHPASRPASRLNPALARQGSRSAPQSGSGYDNGPINGTTDAWTINFGYVVSDTITLTGGTYVTGFDLGVWEFPGDVMTSVDWSITSGPNSGTVYGSGTVSVTDTFISTNQYGYNIDKISALGLNLFLDGGTFWFNLQNASVPSGDPVYWDENSGIGCMSDGCPSQAYDNGVGTIPSESFTVGSPPPECFESQGQLQIIYSFTEQQGGGNGVAIDKTGNLYGTTGGGDNGSGFAYKLTHFAGWLLDPLFSFFGGYNGGPPFSAIVGPNGSLYGGAQGGIQNCGTNGNQYCGLVFNLTPQPTACLTTLCSWTENVPYRFSSESDGSYAGFGGIDVSAFDQEGNLYGTTYTGGTYDAGTVFELTPSGGGWTKTTLYSFTGGNDGSNPTQVLVGNDGNLYGVANNGGMHNIGAVFQLTPSGGQWTESVLHAFGAGEGASPAYLAQDSAGNLYGIVSGFADIFTLQKASSGWAFSEYFVDHRGGNDTLQNLTIDAAGNLYGTGMYFIGTGADVSGMMARSGRRNRIPARMPYDYIFKAGYAGGAWHYEDLVFLQNTYFQAGGSLTLDTSGNLYGTTGDCGTNGSGTVWQLSP
jgi:uncharacterized repeat protein (TIGR03803 family)